MSMNDPLKLKCCYCGKEHTFEDQGAAIATWSVEYNAKEEPIAICNEHALFADAQEMRSALIMGKPPINPLAKPDIVDVGLKTPPVSGIMVKATFKLINVEVSSGGKILSGEVTPVDAICIDSNLSANLEIGKSYYVSLK